MREVLIHLNVSVGDDLDDDMAKRVAIVEAINAARESQADFEELISLVDPQ